MATSYTFDKSILQNLVLQYILVKVANFRRYCLNRKEVLEGWNQRGHSPPPPPLRPANVQNFKRANVSFKYGRNHTWSMLCKQTVTNLSIRWIWRDDAFSTWPQNSLAAVQHSSRPYNTSPSPNFAFPATNIVAESRIWWEKKKPLLLEFGLDLCSIFNI